MQFQVIAYESQVSGDANFGFLLSEDWHDGGKYETKFKLIINDENGKRYTLGFIKIGQKNLKAGQSRGSRKGISGKPNVPKNFIALKDDLFSLGQSEGFYEELMGLSADLRIKILNTLNDVCHNESLFDANKKEKVMMESLLRSVDSVNIKKYRSILKGQAILTPFHFTHTLKSNNNEETTIPSPTLTFDIDPESFPSSNIHILIGRNGVGKSHILKGIASNLNSSDRKLNLRQNKFSKVIHIIFSIFDVDEEYCKNTPSKRILGIVKNTSRENDNDILNEEEQGQNLQTLIKSREELAEELYQSLKICLQGARKDRLKRILNIFSYDDIFQVFDFDDILQENMSKNNIVRNFKKLSSGHAIVLLVIIQLIENVDENTRILLDEPESHLHPPLLSAFIRALSELVRIRNAVIVCATHSPVVLQEVPKNCVWKINRIGKCFKAERPNIETFGENLSVLTREIFGLEVGKTGFHKILQDFVEEGKTYEEILKILNNQLGFEGQLILSSMLSARDAE